MRCCTVGVITCLEQGSGCLHMVQPMLLPFQTPLSLALFESRLVFTTRCYASVVLAMALCPSVCPSQFGVLLKWLNVRSHKQHRTIALGLSFLMPKISAKFDRGHPIWGHQMQVGWVKIGDFRQINGYISKTVKDRHIVSIKVE